MGRIYLPHKILKFSSPENGNKVRNFQHYFEIEFLSSLENMKNCIPSHLFLDVWLQKLYSCYVSLSHWLTTIFLNPWENQKYLFIINLFTSLLQMKLFLQNNIAFTKKCAVNESISCKILFLRLCGCVQRKPFGGPLESTCY